VNGSPKRITIDTEAFIATEILVITACYKKMVEVAGIGERTRPKPISLIFFSFFDPVTAGNEPVVAKMVANGSSFHLESIKPALG
jgi:hypothetical protein